jgi:hypothetical protein
MRPVFVVFCPNFFSFRARSHFGGVLGDMTLKQIGRGPTCRLSSPMSNAGPTPLKKRGVAGGARIGTIWLNRMTGR